MMKIGKNATKKANSATTLIMPVRLLLQLDYRTMDTFVALKISKSEKGNSYLRAYLKLAAWMHVNFRYLPNHKCLDKNNHIITLGIFCLQSSLKSLANTLVLPTFSALTENKIYQMEMSH